MPRSEWGLTDIERRMQDEQRRLRNVIKVLVAIAGAAVIFNYLTQVGNF